MDTNYLYKGFNQDKDFWQVASSPHRFRVLDSPLVRVGFLLPPCRWIDYTTLLLRCDCVCRCSGMVQGPIKVLVLPRSLRDGDRLQVHHDPEWDKEVPEDE